MKGLGKQHLNGDGLLICVTIHASVYESVVHYSLYGEYKCIIFMATRSDKWFFL